MNDVVELSYDLFTLPTAQHRAGLASLLVAVDTMRRRGLPNVPEARIAGLSAACVMLTKASLTALFNDLYDATTEEVRAPTIRKRNGNPIAPLREETEIRRDERTGKESTKTIYVYPQVVPKAPFLQSLGMPDPWLKLWRNAVWSTLRGVPKTRGPYEERTTGTDVREAAGLWDSLRRWQQRGRQYVTEVSSALFIGAQAVNAERVPFVGSPDQNLLLHFWPVVMGVGEAWRIEREEEEFREKPRGYVIAVPDVMDLEGFAADYQASVAQLDTTMYRYRPRHAVLSLPQEGGLQYLNNLVALAAARAQAGAIRFSVAGVEVYHLTKKGNSIAVLATGRVPARRELVEQYEVIRGGRYRNLLFRGQLIRNLLDRQPWYDRFDQLFATHDQELFIGQGDAPFAADAARKFTVEFGASLAGGTMSSTTGMTFDLSKRVHDMIRAYVSQRTEVKSGIAWADFKDRKVTDPTTGRTRIDVPQRYREVRERVWQDAFLSLRACRSREDFVAYFTGTICAVPQYLPMEDYQALAEVLLGDDDSWERVKSLAMLALSAVSRV